MINKDIEKYERKKLFKKVDELERTDPKLAEEYLEKTDPELAEEYAEARESKYDYWIISVLALINMFAGGPAILYLLFLFVPKAYRGLFKHKSWRNNDDSE